VKTRQGFVSNSSSSSFVFVGIYVDDNAEWKEKRPELPKQPTNKADCDAIDKFMAKMQAYRIALKEWEEKEPESLLKVLTEKENLSCEHDDYENDNLVGFRVAGGYDEPSFELDIDDLVAKRAELIEILRKYGIIRIPQVYGGMNNYC